MALNITNNSLTRLIVAYIKKKIVVILIGYIYNIPMINLMKYCSTQNRSKSVYKSIHYITSKFDVPNDNKITDKLTNMAKVYIYPFNLISLQSLKIRL